MAFSFFSNKQNSQSRIVIDIASGSIGGAVVFLSGAVNGKTTSRPKIEYQTRISLPIRAKIDSVSLMSDTKQALEKVLGEIRKNSKAKFTEVDVVCSSPWFSARTRGVSYEKTEAFFVTEKLIREITVKESAKMKSEMDAGVLSIEERIAHIRLNGYESQNPLGKKVKRLDLLLFASFIPKDFAEQTTHSIEAILPAKRIIFHSLPFVSFHTFSRIWHTEKQFAFMHIGAELSEFLLVDGGAIAETLSFPVGVNHLVRSIAASQDVSKELAATSLATYSRGGADAAFNKRIETDTSSIKEEWLAYIDQVVRESLPDHHSVQKMYISADSDTGPFWTQAVHPHIQNAVSLDATTLESFVEHSPAIKLDLSLAVAVLYFNNLHT
ncbi:MAG: hypothetical protein AAB726_00445 [Patescibacteria group bacterium]